MLITASTPLEAVLEKSLDRDPHRRDAATRAKRRRHGRHDAAIENASVSVRASLRLAGDRVPLNFTERPIHSTHMRIDAIDHLVLTVRDVTATTRFYTRVLGMVEVTFGNGRRALAFGAQKINLHETGREYEPKAAVPMPGSADLCFLTTEPLAAVVGHLRACGVQVVEGPVTRTGARGRIASVYCRDPDGNLLEISSYATTEQFGLPA